MTQAGAGPAYGKDSLTGPCSHGCDGNPAGRAGRLGSGPGSGPGSRPDTGEQGAGVGGAENAKRWGDWPTAKGRQWRAAPGQMACRGHGPAREVACSRARGRRGRPASCQERAARAHRFAVVSVRGARMRGAQRARSAFVVCGCRECSGFIEKRGFLLLNPCHHGDQLGRTPLFGHL